MSSFTIVFVPSDVSLPIEERQIEVLPGK
eukprot:SAG11_NODE_17355_length_521_cov_0.606635_1_plen_28_part_10